MEQKTRRPAPATAPTGTPDPAIITDASIAQLTHEYQGVASRATHRAAVAESHVAAIYRLIAAEALTAIAGLAALTRDVPSTESIISVADSVADGEVAWW